MYFAMFYVLQVHNPKISESKCTLALIDKLPLMRNHRYHDLDIILTLFILITILIPYNGHLGHSKLIRPLYCELD